MMTESAVGVAMAAIEPAVPPIANAMTIRRSLANILNAIATFVAPVLEVGGGV